MNNFFEKYNKYKSKNDILLQKIQLLQIGGTLVDINNIKVNHENLTFFVFNGDILRTSRHSISDTKLVNNSDYVIEANGTQDNYKIEIKTLVNSLTVMKLTNNKKTFFIKKKNLVIEINEDTSRFIEQSYFKCNNADIKIQKGNIIILGKCDITKNVGEDIKISVKIESINGKNFISTVDKFDMYEFISEFDQISDFDYENSYDSFKTENLSSFCEKSPALLKNLYNAHFNMFFLNNTDTFNLLKNGNGKLIEFMLLKEMCKIKDNIFRSCENNDDRETMLKNILKRIETHNPHFLIKNSTLTYVKLPEQFKVIFDTGNSSFTIIGKEIVEYLGLMIYPTFKSVGSGVGGSSKYDDGYVDITLKMSDSSPYYLKDVYHTRAIIDDNNLKDTLLIGHSSSIFRDFLKNNYCVGYDHERSHSSNMTDAEMYDIYKVIDKNIDNLIGFFNDFVKITNNFKIITDGSSTIIENFLNKSLILLTLILNNKIVVINLDKFNKIYNKTKDIFLCVEKIKNTQLFNSSDISKSIDTIDKLKIDMI